MSEWRRVKGCGKRDRNEPDIVAALEAQGAVVAKLSATGVPDLLVGHAGRTLLMEVKVDNERLRPEQERWHSAWSGGPVLVVRTPAQAVKALRTVRVEAACAEDAIRFGGAKR